MIRLMILSLAVVASLFAQSASGAGAGRAFPVESENFAIEAFHKVNPNIEWDPTNYLVDLSGYYANCKQRLGKTKSEFKTAEGADIWVFVESTRGDASDIDAVNGYIRDVINRWLSGGQISSEIREAKRFGCSVRPKCTGQAVIACVGTDGKGTGATTNGPLLIKRPDDKVVNGAGWHGNGDRGDGGRGDGGRGTIPPVTARRPDGPQHEKEHPEGYHPKAYAFTSEQYDIAETILKNKWDRSHFLEDLSGLETDCAMIGRNDWHFDKMQTPAKERNMKISPQYGNAPNKGSTTDALKEILKTFKPVSSARQTGCSIIPDCKTSHGMEVVISCLYQDA